MLSETIQYRVDGANFEGALIYDDRNDATPRPLVLMAPNWLGVTPTACERAMLLGVGRYVVFVADLYGSRGRPRNVSDAARLSEPIKAQPQLARARMHAALEAATREAGRRNLWDGKHRAAVGFCFGGGNVLELARSGAGLQAVISIHGDLATSEPATRGTVCAAILAIHGGADPVVPSHTVAAFQAEMTEAQASWQLHVFGALLHAYTDQDADVPGVARYDEPGARQSYALTHAFIASANGGLL